MLIANVAPPLMMAPRWSSVKYVVLGHTYTALDSLFVVQKRSPLKCHTCNPSAQKKSTKSTQRASNTKTSKSAKKSNSSLPTTPVVTTSTTPAVTTSTTSPTTTPAPPNAALGEGNASSATTLQWVTLVTDAAQYTQWLLPLKLRSRLPSTTDTWPRSPPKNREQIPAPPGPGLRRT